MPSIAQMCEEYSLSRDVPEPDSQAYHDRLSLSSKIWPFFYFNYIFANSFEQRVNELVTIKDPQSFKEELFYLFHLHYISGLMSLTKQEIQEDKIFHRHFADMQYGAYSVASSIGKTPQEIINCALTEMLYHDITYNWSRSMPFGKYNSYYSANSLLYMVKRKIENG